METPILYRAAVRPRYRRAANPLKPTVADFEFSEPGSYDHAAAEAGRLDREHRATVVLIEKTCPFPANSGSWYLCRILR